MATRSRRFGWHWTWLLAAVAALLMLGPAARPSAAAEIEKAVPSLQLVPETAAFYGTMLRNRQQYDAVVNSRAWAKLKKLSFVQFGLTMYALQAGNPDSVPGKIEAMLKDAEIRKLLGVVADMWSHEVFCYGEEDMVAFLQLAQKVANDVRFGPALLMATGKTEDMPENKIQAMVLLSSLARNRELLKVPSFVVGFKLKNPAAAKDELDLAEKQLTAILERIALLKGRFQKSRVAGHDYLTLSLDGRMVPWNKLPLDKLKEVEAEKGDAEKVIARLKQMTLVIALGLRDDYLLLSVGPTTDVLARLGQGKHLADRPELAPLAKFANERLTSVGYVSKALTSQVGTNRKDIDDLMQVLDKLLPLAELPEKDMAQIRKDATALAADVKGLVAESGAAMGFSFLTASGSESYQYDWSEHRGTDSSKPLGLLAHVGGNPLLAVVGRGKVSQADYDLLAKWAAVGYGYIEKYAVPKMPDADRANFQKFMTQVRPLVKRLDDTTRRMLLPALADGQTALVVDAKLSSKQYVAALPPTEKPMPMIEPALVFGVSDADLLRKACLEYRAIADDLLAAVRKIEGAEIPKEFKLPNAQVSQTPLGTIYAYPLPKEWGVDAKIVPNAGLSAKVAVLSTSRQHTERLLADTPATVGGKPVATDRPRAVAVMFDFAGLVDAATPWVDLAVQKIMEQKESDENAIATMTAQAHIVLDVLKVLRNVVSESYLEGEALVTHTRTEIRDLEK